MAISNYFLGHSRLFSMKKWGVPNAPFFILIFCQISDHKWKCFGGKTSRFSKKLPKTILNSCENFYGRGFSHFCATPIWNSVPRHMTHPVYSQFSAIFKLLLSPYISIYFNIFLYISIYFYIILYIYIYWIWSIQYLNLKIIELCKLEF